MKTVTYMKESTRAGIARPVILDRVTIGGRHVSGRGRPVEKTRESYFFRLSKYEDRLGNCSANIPTVCLLLAHTK